MVGEMVKLDTPKDNPPATELPEWLQRDSATCTRASSPEPKPPMQSDHQAGIEKGIETSPRDSEDVPCSTESVNQEAPITKLEQVKTLIAACTVQFIIQGYTQAFGVMQNYYGSEAAAKEGRVRPDDITKRATIAAIGSLGNGGIVALFGVFFYPWLPYLGKYVKLVCLIATVLMCLGMGTAIASSTLAHLVGTQGLVYGIGSGLMFYSLSPILPTYFHDHVGFAQGIAMSFSSIGGVAFSLLEERIIQKYGTQTTLALLCGVFGLLGILVVFTVQPPRKLGNRLTTFDWKAFKDPSFSLFMVANFVHPLTFMVPMNFGPDFSASLGFSLETASVLLAIGSGVSFFARLGLGGLSDKFGHQNVMMLGMVLYEVGIWILWIPASMTNNKACWVCFLLVHGVISGSFLTLVNSVLKELYGPELYYSYAGPFTTFRGIAFLIGNPIVGSIMKRVPDSKLTPPDFVGAIVYIGVLVGVATICLAGVRFLDAKKTGWKTIR